MKTIEEIIKIEPRIKQMFDYAEAPERLNNYWENNYSNCKIKFRIQTIVGRFADNESLRSSEDYDTVIKHLVSIVEVNSKEYNEEDDCEEYDNGGEL